MLLNTMLMTVFFLTSKQCISESCIQHSQTDAGQNSQLHLSLALRFGQIFSSINRLWVASNKTK